MPQSLFYFFSSLLFAILLYCAAATAMAQSFTGQPETTASRSVTAVEAGLPMSPSTFEYVATKPDSTAIQASVVAPVQPVQVPPQLREHTVIGSATEHLFSVQRTLAAQRPRPIDGEQASRSYQRYLKSFETTIPEQFEMGLDVKR